MRSFTWRAFALFVAAPALLLAWLGLRAVGAERLEAEQQLRDQQTGAARLADAALASALNEMGRDLLRSRVPSVGTPIAISVSGLLTFPRDRVYFGAFAQHPPDRTTAAVWPAAISDLVEEAQSAEAQGRHGEAVAALRALQQREPRLRGWAELTTARIRMRRAPSAGALAVLSDPGWSHSPATTPSGLPVAILASALSAEFPGETRAVFAPLVTQTLTGLVEGRWWLSADERRFYERELIRLLQRTSEGAADEGQGGRSRLAELADIEHAIRQSLPSRRDTPTYTVERGLRSPYLVVWAPYDPATETWRGLAVPQEQIPRVIQSSVSPLFDGLPFRAAIRDAGGRLMSEAFSGTVWRVERLQTVHGWEIAFTGPTESQSFARRQWLWYGFIAVLLLVLFGGIAMTAQNVRQKTELARLQSDFIAAVTHEFKSPITSIRLLLERIGAGRLTSPEAASAYAIAIGREADRLERLVNRLLQAQQIDAGHQRYQFAEASIEQLTTDAVRQIQPFAESRNIRMTVDVDDDLPPVMIDRAVMGDAVENLLDNAIKYSGPGTAIRVRVHAEHGRLCIDVEDQGIGIEADEIPRVFDRFYRARRGNVQNVRGTGLGLALVKAAADAHGGSVDVASEPGKGSRFTIRLPMPETAAAS